MKDSEEVRRYYEAILPYYDQSLAGRGDLPFWDAMAMRWKPKRILELGCGTGRVTEVLVRHADVTAVDLLVEMLRLSCRRAPAKFVASDLRQFAFARRFDLIVLADDPMAHLISIDDRASALQLIADHLTPDGRVVIEGLYRREPGNSQQRRGPLMIDESWETTADPSVWKAHYRYEKNGSVVDVSSVLRSWSPADFELLATCGLHVESMWGDFDECPFSDRSKRMIIVAVRE